jgi:hypothetical protein
MNGRRILAGVVVALTVMMLIGWVGPAESRDSQATFNSDATEITAASISLQSALSTPISLTKRGFVVVTTGADDSSNSGHFCEISIGVADAATPAAFTEVFAARKTYQSQNSLLSNTYVVGPVPRGDHVLHFLFKRNAAGSDCKIRQRTITGIYVPRDADGQNP